MAKKPVHLIKAPREPVPLAEVALRLHPADDVAIAKLPLAHGTLILGDEGEVRLRQLVPAGHKRALRAVREGEAVRRYGQIIGFATRPIEPGDQVHTHNIAVKEVDRIHDFCADYEAVEVVPQSERRTFRGFRRSDGRVGTRNYIAVLASVNCSSSATAAVVDHFRRSDALDRFAN